MSLLLDHRDTTPRTRRVRIDGTAYNVVLSDAGHIHRLALHERVERRSVTRLWQGAGRIAYALAVFGFFAWMGLHV